MHRMRLNSYRPRAHKKHLKGQHVQLLNDFILYSLTTLACTSFCSSPLWYPPFCATFNVFFFFSLPKITSFFFTSKALFIVGNLIVIFLIGESKFFTSKSKSTYNDVCNLPVKSEQPKGNTTDNDVCNLPVISEQPKGNTTKETSYNDTQMKILESKHCEEHDEEEFFESYNDEETCECLVDDNVDDLSCSKEDEGEKRESIEGDVELNNLPAEDLNKLADDFIARIIRQRRLEAEFCRG